MALLVSAAVHLCALVFIWQLRAPKDRRDAQQTISLVLQRPALAPMVAVLPPSPPTKPPSRKIARPKATSERADAVERGPQAPEVREGIRVTGGAPRKLSLPSFVTQPKLGLDASSLGETSEPKGEDEGDTHARAEKALAQITEGMRREHAAKRTPIDQRTGQIGRAIANAFTANVGAAKHRIAPNGVVAAEVMGVVEQWQRDMPKGMIGSGTAALDGGTQLEERRKEKAYPDGKDHFDMNFCVGACNQGSHEQARLSTSIAIDHDERGVPIRWTVDRSSGQPAFDEDALSSVQLALGCMKDSQHHVLFCRPLEQKSGPVPRHTRWVLHGIVWRWSHAERLLDPLFKPTGKRIATGLFAGSYLESAVELVELAYWDGASQPASIPN
jgi:hypothetical protein